MNLLKFLGVLLLGMSLLAPALACGGGGEDQGTMEQMGEQMDEAVDEAAGAAEEAMEDAGEEMEQAQEEMEE